MANWQALLLGVLIGAVLALIWSDVASILRVAAKTKYGTPDRDHTIDSMIEGLTRAVPRWLAAVVTFTGLALLLAGAAQVWQYNQFSNYQSCVEARDAVQNQAQELRTGDLIKKEKALSAWLSAVAPALQEGATPEQIDTLRKESKDVAEAQQDYLETVAENPYPDSVQEVCGSVED